jgi:hypothetical protein
VWVEKPPKNGRVQILVVCPAEKPEEVRDISSEQSPEGFDLLRPEEVVEPAGKPTLKPQQEF